MTRPRSLLITPVAPDDKGNGLAMRASVVADGLRRSGDSDTLVIPIFAEPTGRVDVTVLALDRQTDPTADFAERLGHPASRARAMALHPRPTLCSAATLAAAEAVATAVALAEADVVYVLRGYLMPWLDAVIDATRRPRIVLDLDDVDSISLASLGQHEEAARHRRLEGHYLPLVDQVILAAPADLTGLEPPTNATVIPNSVRIPATIPSVPPEFDLIFVGNLSYQPNVEGIRWFCREVLPRLSGVRLVIVGSNPIQAVSELARDSRVTLAANVEEISSWYASSRLAIVPLHAGGGTPTKVIEAMAHARPVVTTTFVAGRFAGTPVAGELVTAADPAEFAAACRALLEDDTVGAAAGMRAREVASTYADREIIADAVAALVCNIRRHD